MKDRFDYEDGSLDDVVINDVEMFRLERMDDGLIWMRCYRKGQPDVVLHISSKARVVAACEFDD